MSKYSSNSFYDYLVSVNRPILANISKTQWRENRKQKSTTGFKRMRLKFDLLVTFEAYLLKTLSAAAKVGL